MSDIGKNRFRPMLVAHRGARDEAPENTLSAFRQALGYPIDGIEFDVQMSKDGVPVIHHDETLSTISAGSQRVSEVDFKFLKQLDWGKRFHKSFTGEPPATFEDVLTLLAGRTRLFVEIKSFTPERQSGHISRVVDKTLMQLAKVRPLLDPKQVAILSFDQDILIQSFHQADQWRYVYNVPEEKPESVMEIPSRLLNILWAIDVEISRLSSDLVQWAQSKDLKVMTYTCNNTEHVQKAMAMGVYAIITDKPGWLTRHMATC